MPRGSEAIDTKPRSFPIVQTCKSQRPVSDDASAQKRSGVDIFKPIRNRIDKPGGGRHIFGESPVACPAGELCRLAKILSARSAEPTIAAGAMEPRSPDSLPRAQTRDVVRDLFDDPDNLVSRNHGRKFLRQLALDNMKVGSTNSTRLYAAARSGRPKVRAGPDL